VVTVLTPIYESEFLGFSYGFRPKRNQHQALDALAFGIGKRRINWVLDCDVQSFFDKVTRIGWSASSSIGLATGELSG
jgi:Retron-type reverse transcriptase